MKTKGVLCRYTYRRGLSRCCSFRLLWAMREPLRAGRVTGTDSPPFFIYELIKIYLELSGSGNLPTIHLLSNMKVTDFSFQSENLAVEYVAPQVEIIEVEVEKGFAQSNEPYSRREFNWDE